MTHDERTVIYSQMREYKAQGHTNKEVAKHFKCSKSTAQRVCNGICDLSHKTNQYTNGKFDRIENCKRIIEEHNPNLEYFGGFTDTDSSVDVRCKICGYVFNRSMITLRGAKNTVCPECEKANKLKKKEQEKLERLKQTEKHRHEIKMERMLAKSYTQASFKTCPVCNTAFLGNNVYCSERCRNQNRWMMKDGYRRKFPLEELYKRDKGICYLCGGLCDWNDKTVVDGVTVYGNSYPSRDHVVPKSKGGENSWNNLRLAHRLCNSLKSDSPLVKKIV